MRYENLEHRRRTLLPCHYSWLVMALFCLTSVLAASCSSAGEDVRLQPVAPQTVQVGAELTVELVVLNAGGSAPVFSATSPTLPDLQARSHPPRFIPFGAGAYFRWVPVAADVGQHIIELSATVGSATDIKTFSVTIIPGSASPVFIKPLGSGKTLDLGQNPCFEVDIEVQDPDTQEVNIYLEQPLENGYELTDIPPSKAKFQWCPTPVQAAASTRYAVNFAADDGNGHVARKNYTLLLRAELGRDCANGDGEGRPPRIEHDPPVLLTAGDTIELTALIADDKGLADAPRFHYTFTPPSDPLNFEISDLNTVEMSRESGNGFEGVYKASVPLGPSAANENPAASPSLNSSSTGNDIYYLIEATDDDDPNGDCDNRVIAPERALFTAPFERGETSGGRRDTVCEPCATDADCGADVCVPLFEGGQYCLPRCSEGPTDICGSIGFQGCCDGDVVTWCGGSEVQTIPCQVQGSCGWNDAEGTYGCRTSGMGDPSGRFPKTCPSAQAATCPPGYACSSVPSVSVGGTQSRVCLPEGGRCAGLDCVDDELEENDSQGQANSPLSFGRTYANLRLCGNGMSVDEDFYGLSLTEDAEVRIGLTFSHALGDLDLTLLDWNGQILNVGYSSTDNEQIDTCLMEGYYYLHVWSINRDVNASYDLELETIGLGMCCQDDPQEDDDSSLAAQPVQPNDVLSQQICPNDEDWFAIDLIAGALLSVDLTFQQNSDDEDLDVSLIDIDGLRTLSSATSSDSNETLEYQVEMTGTYYVGVKGFVGASNAYTIRFSATPGP